MKNKTLFLIIIILLGAIQPSFGAFPVKHAATNSSVTTTCETTNVRKANYKFRKPSWFAAHVTDALHSYSERLNPERRRSDTNGILSLIFGIAGLIPFYGLLFCIPAIVLGAVGMHRDEKFSLTGLILGISGIVLFLVEVIVLAAIIATSLVLLL